MTSSFNKVYSPRVECNYVLFLFSRREKLHSTYFIGHLDDWKYLVINRFFEILKSKFLREIKQFNKVWQYKI